MAGIPGIHTQLDIGILADVSILATVFVFVSSITTQQFNKDTTDQ